MSNFQLRIVIRRRREHMTSYENLIFYTSRNLNTRNVLVLKCSIFYHAKRTKINGYSRWIWNDFIRFSPYLPFELIHLSNPKINLKNICPVKIRGQWAVFLGFLRLTQLKWCHSVFRFPHSFCWHKMSTTVCKNIFSNFTITHQ